VQLFNNFAGHRLCPTLVAGYGYTYTDPNDPLGAVNDVRWAVVTVVNRNVTADAIVVGAFRRGM